MWVVYIDGCSLTQTTGNGMKRKKKKKSTGPRQTWDISPIERVKESVKKYKRKPKHKRVDGE